MRLELTTFRYRLSRRITVGRCNQLSHGACVSRLEQRIYYLIRLEEGWAIPSPFLYDNLILIADDMPPTPANGTESQIPRKSDRFWFDDGSVLVSLVPSVYKVHKSILDRLSKQFVPWLLDATDPAALALSRAIGHVGTPVIAVPDKLGITTEDFETLLAHLYHDS